MIVEVVVGSAMIVLGMVMQYLLTKSRQRHHSTPTLPISHVGYTSPHEPYDWEREPRWYEDWN